jgi:hypothetical protein
MMAHVGNILNPIHSGLATQIWDDPVSEEPTLKPHVADFIKHTIYHALEVNGYARPKQWLHLVLTGSLTTYQYDDDSDCDISLFVNSEVFPEWSRAEMVAIMVDHCDGIKVPGSPFVLQDYVVPAHIKPADLYRPGLRSGWDIDSQRWITPPERARVHDVQAQENGFYVYALEQADKMDRLLKYEPKKAETFWHQIHERRRRDMASGKGDFAESNIVYKFLANRGLFPKIADLTGEHIANNNEGGNDGQERNRAGEGSTLRSSASRRRSMVHAFSPASPEEFLNGFNQAIQSHPRAAYVTKPTPEELAERNIWLAENGKVGYTVTPEGEIANAFRHPEATPGAASSIMEHGMANGGYWANCFDKAPEDKYGLPDLYRRCGMTEQARLPFDPAQAPSGWNPDHGSPDVVFMSQGGPERPNNYVNDWDEAQMSAQAAGHRVGKTAASAAVDRLKRLVSESIDYGDIYVNDGRRKVLIVLGDADSNELHDKCRDEAKLAYPGYKVEVEAEVGKPKDIGWRKIADSAKMLSMTDYSDGWGLSPMAEDPLNQHVYPPADAWGYPPQDDGWGYSPMAEEPLDQEVYPSRPRTAATLPKSKIPVGKMTPEQKAEYAAAQVRAKAESLQWLQNNPRSPENILNHWHQTTPEHRDQGMSWYQDAHLAAKQIAQDRGITVNQAAGLIANYSPQQHWATNLEMASRAAAGQRIGGPKEPGQRGFMASKSQADVAARIMSGEDYHGIFGGKKITGFGHLIEHGQDTDPNDPKVVVDRHALGVAHGGYADDGVYTYSKVSSGVRKDGSSPAYDDVANMYKQAADTINANGGHNGVPIQPHQLQAATWLTRQRLNAEGGYSGNDSRVADRTRKVAESSVNNWNAYAAANHPALVGKTPGTGFSGNTGAGGFGTQSELPSAQTLSPAIAKTAWTWAEDGNSVWHF